MTAYSSPFDLPASGGSSRTLIDVATPVAASSVVFSSIPQGYRNLFIETSLVNANVSGGGTAEDDVFWWVNNNTNAASYYLQDDGRFGGSVAGGHLGSANNIAWAGRSDVDPIYCTIHVANYAQSLGNILGYTTARWSHGTTSIVQLWRLSRFNA